MCFAPQLIGVARLGQVKGRDNWGNYGFYDFDRLIICSGNFVPKVKVLGVLVRDWLISVKSPLAISLLSC
jgi:hypothetical protein